RSSGSSSPPGSCAASDRRAPARYHGAAAGPLAPGPNSEEPTMRTMTVILLAAALAGPGCAKRHLDKMDKNEDNLYAEYEKTDYDKDMVKAEEGLNEYDREAQASVSP